MDTFVLGPFWKGGPARIKLHWIRIKLITSEPRQIA